MVSNHTEGHLQRRGILIIIGMVVAASNVIGSTKGSLGVYQQDTLVNQQIQRDLQQHNQTRVPPASITSIQPSTSKPKHNQTIELPFIPLIDYNYTFLHYEDARSRFPLPNWLDEFLQTQPVASHFQTLTQDPNATFIVMTCYKYANKHVEDCGGIADRFLQLPYMLWLARKTNRKLLIHYFKPRPLEEFLVPPPTGFDWRMPDGFLQNELWIYGNRTSAQYNQDRLNVWHTLMDQPPHATQRAVFVNNNLAIPMAKAHMDRLLGSPAQDLWPGLFRRMFQPSRQVAQEMASLVREHRLKAGDYAAVHLRVRYPGTLGVQIQYKNKHWRADKQGGGLNMNDANTSRAVALLGNHAVDCAARIMPQAKLVYVASDSNEVVEYLKYHSPQWADNRTKATTQSKWEGASNNRSSDPMEHGWGVPPWNVSTQAKIIARPKYHVEPLHFDGAVWDKPDGGYATFVDLWLMAHAKCHSHGVGGFGLFASILSGNRNTCSSQHRDKINLSPSCATPTERAKWEGIR